MYICLSMVEEMRDALANVENYVETLKEFMPEDIQLACSMDG